MSDKGSHKESENEVKVTDKRMFTADGELREEYRSLEEQPADPAAATREQAPPREPEPEAAVDAARAGGPTSLPPDGPRLEIPDTGPVAARPSFFDLVAVLADSVSVYLGDVELPDGKSAQNVEMARLYIDLLDLLREKTLANLTAQESAFLEEVLYRLRLRYVQKRG